MRYRLAHSRDIKKNRWNNVCPSCGQRKFSPYIDTTTNRPIAEKECGRCCREKSCAYHLRPSEWFKDNPPEKREWLPKEQYMELMQQRRREAEQASPNPLPKRAGGEAKKYCERMSTLCHKTRSDKNHLARWLCTLFPEEQVAATLARYRTGSTRDGRIIYWQIDECGQVRAGKVMAYDLHTGHRIKGKTPSSSPSMGSARPSLHTNPGEQSEGAPHRGGAAQGAEGVCWGGSPVCWVHSMKIDGIRFNEMLMPQCLFGLHLIETRSVYENENDNRYPLPCRADARGVSVCDEEIFSFPEECASAPRSLACEIRGGSPCLVESEKSALIMSLLCPDRVWLATGGKQNFKEQMVAPLAGMEVTLFPDADALTDWYPRAMELNRTLGTKLHIPTWYYDLMNHPEVRTAGWDLADVVLSNEQ